MQDHNYIFNNKFNKFYTAISFYKVATQLFRSACTCEDYVTVGFHLHQAVEYTLKGFLCSNGINVSSNSLIKLMGFFELTMPIDVFEILDTCWENRHSFNCNINRGTIEHAITVVGTFLENNYVSDKNILTEAQLQELNSTDNVGNSFECNISYAIRMHKGGSLDVKD